MSGTQPVESCRLHGGAGGTRVASWETAPSSLPATAGDGTTSPTGGAPAKPRAGSRARGEGPPPASSSAQAPQQAKKEAPKEGLLQQDPGCAQVGEGPRAI